MARRLLRGVHRVAFLLYPRPFRRRFAAQMHADYDDAVRRAWADGGATAVLRLQLRSLVDVVRSAARERRRPGAVRPAGGRELAPGGPWGWLGSVVQDVRYALRTLAASPAFTLAAVASIAAGIGANVTIFAFVDAALIRPLPWPEAERLVQIDKRHREMDLAGMAFGSAEFLFVRDAQDVLEAASGIQRDAVVVTGGDRPLRLQAVRVLPGLLEMLGLEPPSGRAFAGREFVPGDDRVAILSAARAAELFGAPAAAVGESVEIDGELRDVVGVLAPGARFPDGSFDVVLPAALTDAERTDPGSFTTFLSGIGRLRRGVGPEAAREALSRAISAFEESSPDLWAGWEADVEPLRQRIVGPTTATTLHVLSAAVLAVLLAACANVANLLLARGARRSREIALRAALGAGRGRLVRQLVTESLVLAVLGGAVGVGLAALATRLLVALGPASLPRLEAVGIDLRVLGFAAAVVVVAGTGFGLVPALGAGRQHLAAALRDGDRVPGTSRGIRRVRAALTVAEVALAVVLVVGATLMVRTVGELLAVEPGFRPSGVVRLQVGLPDFRYPEAEQRRRMVGEIVERLGQVPGVEAVGAADWLPLSGSWSRSQVVTEGMPAEVTEDLRFVDEVWATPGYLEAMGIRRLSGRGLEPGDAAGAPRVVLVSETMARLFWPDRTAVGARVSFDGAGPDAEWWTVVGVVGDVRASGLQAAPRPTLYRPLAQGASTFLPEIVARAGGEASAVLPRLREAVWSVAGELPVPRAGLLDDLLADQMERPRFVLAVVGLMGAVAVVLAAVGIYGLITYLVGHATREIGVRRALGASRRRVLLLVARQGLGPLAAGIGLGLAAAAALTRWMSALLYEVEAFDPLTFLVVAASLALIGSVATLVPAHRATRIDPLVALRWQ